MRSSSAAAALSRVLLRSSCLSLARSREHAACRSTHYRPQHTGVLQVMFKLLLFGNHISTYEQQRSMAAAAAQQSQQLPALAAISLLPHLVVLCQLAVCCLEQLQLSLQAGHLLVEGRALQQHSRQHSRRQCGSMEAP